MFEIQHKKEATEITPDGIAAAAATLAVESKYLQENTVLSSAFWYFFDLLLEHQHWAKEKLDAKKITREEAVEGGELWESERWKVSGRLKTRAYRALYHGYYAGVLLKPIAELTDDDLLALRGIGLKTLAAIRAIIPSPAPLSEGVKDEQ